jgi:hypothetical protein
LSFGSVQHTEKHKTTHDTTHHTNTITMTLYRLPQTFMLVASIWFASPSNQRVVDEVAAATDVPNIDADDFVSDAEDDTVADREDVLVEAPVAAATATDLYNIDADEYVSDADDVPVEASVAAATMEAPLRRSKRVVAQRRRALRSGVAPSPYATSGLRRSARLAGKPRVNYKY